VNGGAGNGRTGAMSVNVEPHFSPLGQAQDERFPQNHFELNSRTFVGVDVYVVEFHLGRRTGRAISGMADGKPTPINPTQIRPNALMQYSDSFASGRNLPE